MHFFQKQTACGKKQTMNILFLLHLFLTVERRRELEGAADWLHPLTSPSIFLYNALFTRERLDWRLAF